MTPKGNKTFSSIVAAAVIVVLATIQLQVNKPLLLLERFVAGGGWIQISALGAYSWFLAYRMSSPGEQAKWRVKSWTIFSIVFFSQLGLGMLVDSRFLMSGDLHLPVPMMILAGPVYRMQISFMPILFLSTVVLSGPAWCSQLCYFGALDAQASKGRRKGIKKDKSALKKIRFTVLVLVITAAVLLRIFKVPVLYTTILAALFGIAGLFIITGLSRKSGRMIHCISYCPIGTLIAYLKFLNPFRFKIASSCTSCYRCIPECKYGALDKDTISKQKPGINCTLCGDCISVCKPGSLHYKFPGLDPVGSKFLYLGITISLHAIFMAMARI